MKRAPGFLEGVGVALVLSIIGGALFTMFSLFMAPGFLVRALIAGLSFSYVLYLLWRAHERIGLLTVLTGWLVSSILIWFLSPSILLYLLLHLGLIWLIRSLYFYTGILPALLDLGLSGMALLIALGAGLHTGSFFIGLWCFFLAQALFVFIPASMHRKSRGDAGTAQEDRFEHAHRVATDAVRKLSSIH